MHRRAALLTLSVYALLACGGDAGTGPGTTTGSSMTATVDGQPWNPPSSAVQASRANGGLAMAATATAGNTTTTVSITLTTVAATGTFQLNPTFAGQHGVITRSQGAATNTASWTTLLSPGTGAVTISVFTDDRVAGTFHFTGQAAPGTAATGQASVTSGSFDIRF